MKLETIEISDDVYHILINNKFVELWNDSAHRDYPEDLIMSRMIGGLIHTVATAAYQAGLEENKKIRGEG